MSNLTDIQSKVAFWNDLNTQVIYYFTIASSAIGLPTNIFSAWIFIRIMKKNKTSMGFLFLVQSIVDFFYLLLLLLILRPTQIFFKINILNYSDFTCRIITFGRRYMSHMSVAVTLVVTFDRFLAVCYPNQASNLMKRKSVLLGLIFTLFVLMAVSDIANLFFYVSYQNPNNPVCTADPTIFLAADMIAIIIRCYIPFPIMVVMNFFIVRKMKQSSRASLKQTNQTRKENHFTNAVIAYDAFFIICCLPLAVFYIIYDVFSISGTFKVDQVMGAVYNFWLNNVISMSYCKQVFIFFMNLFFNKMFWNETKFALFNKNEVENSSSRRQTTNNRNSLN